MMELNMKFLSSLLMGVVSSTVCFVGDRGCSRAIGADDFALASGQHSVDTEELQDQSSTETNPHANAVAVNIPDEPSGVFNACHESDEKKSDSETSLHKDEKKTAATLVERWVLGIRCELAPSLLRHHLKLGEAGVVILSVHPETPAADADLKVGDIIVQMDDDQLTCRDDLTQRVQASEGELLKLAIIREGQRRAVEITPRKMMVEVLMAPATSGNSEPVKNEGEGENHVNLRNVYPGVLFEGGLPDLQEAGADPQQNVEKILHQLRVMAKQQSAQNSSVSGRIIIDMNATGEGTPSPQSESALLTKTIATLHRQMANIQKDIDALEKRLQALKTMEKAPQKKEGP